MGIMRTKSIEQSIRDTEEPEFQLRKALGPWDLTLFGIGVIIGTGLFVLTGEAAAGYAGPAVALSYVVGGIVCALAALCYAEFASTVPVAGSAYTFSYASLGEFVAWLIGWDLILEFTLGAATVAKGWSEYLVSVLEIVESAPAAHPPGTTVEVRNLFLNLPVRRGFLGTERAEANAVSTVVEALALSRPQVGFFLRSGGRGALTLPTAADLRERISQVHGLALARSLVALEDPVVWGFVSPLAVSFPTRRYTHVAVNGRVVDTDSFAPAISNAYADLLPKGRHPAAFLRLELGPGEVDVNVHPAKSAVRLRGGRSAYPLVVGTIRAALAPEREIGGGTAPEEQVAELTPIGQFAGRCIPCLKPSASGRRTGRAISQPSAPAATRRSSPSPLPRALGRASSWGCAGRTWTWSGG